MAEKNSFPHFQQTHSIPEPLNDRTQLVKEQIKLHTFQYIQEHPIYPLSELQQNKMAENHLEKGQNTSRCFNPRGFVCCHQYQLFVILVGLCLCDAIAV